MSVYEASSAVTDSATGKWLGPPVVQASDEHRLDRFAAAGRHWIDAKLLQHGGILFRGFTIDSIENFRSAAVVLCDELTKYVYRSTPRHAVNNGVYTATEYRANASIPMHNENAYQRDWPMKLVFGCLQPAAVGGETPLALTAAVTNRIDCDVVDEFCSRHVLYVRNFGHGVDLDWQTTFQTDSKSDVESYCQQHGIEWEWLSPDRLQTRQECQATARHPVTDQELWFNQAHLFHLSSLPPEHRRAMLEQFGEESLPRNAYFGDGTSIDEGVLDDIRAAYEAEKVVFSWQKGDVLLLDNMLVAHGRNPYQGTRQVLVAMGNVFSNRVQEEVRHE